MEGEDMSKDEKGSANARVVVAPGASTPATDQDYAALKTQFDDVVTNKLGRWVAALAALSVPLVTAFCAWAQDKIGINLDPAALTAFITSMGAGIAITAYKWLSNRGDWERTAVQGYHVYLTGQAATTNQVVVAPGASAPPAASTRPTT
jgi:hypothetical protein